MNVIMTFGCVLTSTSPGSVTFWLATWADATMDSTIAGRVKEMAARSTAEAQKRGLLHPFQ